MRNRGIVILAAAAVLVPANVDGQRDRQGNRNDRQNRQDERWEDTRGPGYDNDRYLDEGRYDYDDGYRYDDRYERPSDRYRGPYSRRNPRSSDWRYQNWGDFHLYAPRGLQDDPFGLEHRTLQAFVSRLASSTDLQRHFEIRVAPINIRVQH